MTATEAVAAALDVAIDYLTSAESIEDEPTMADGALVLATALRAAGYQIVPVT